MNYDEGKDTVLRNLLEKYRSKADSHRYPSTMIRRKFDDIIQNNLLMSKTTLNILLDVDWGYSLQQCNYIIKNYDIPLNAKVNIIKHACCGNDPHKEFSELISFLYTNNKITDEQNIIIQLRLADHLGGEFTDDMQYYVNAISPHNKVIYTVLFYAHGELIALDYPENTEQNFKKLYDNIPITNYDIEFFMLHHDAPNTEAVIKSFIEHGNLDYTDEDLLLLGCFWLNSEIVIKCLDNKIIPNSSHIKALCSYDVSSLKLNKAFLAYDCSKRRGYKFSKHKGQETKTKRNNILKIFGSYGYDLTYEDCDYLMGVGINPLKIDYNKFTENDLIDLFIKYKTMKSLYENLILTQNQLYIAVQNNNQLIIKKALKQGLKFDDKCMALVCSSSLQYKEKNELLKMLYANNIKLTINNYFELIRKTPSNFLNEHLKFVVVPPN